jgi:hypothetical protein
MERTMRRIPLLIGSLLPLLGGALLAQDAAPPPGSGDPPARVARISSATGTVSFQPSGDTTWSLASVNYPLTTGDRLYTDRGARAELQAGRLTLRVAEGSDLTVTSLTDQFTQVGMAQGILRVSVYEMAPGDSVEIDTPRGALTLLAAGEYRVDAPSDDSPMVVAVGRGTLEWTAGGVAQLVKGGQAITISGIDVIQVASVALAAPDAFDQWSADRDRKLASSPSAKFVGRDIPGYADLDEAGTWQPDAEYGPVWYPTGVAVDWAPYRHGHWAWIEPWGWTWVEREPWGYAPFHYGRWAFVRSRWGWVPGSWVGRPYYAPALVVFVDGDSFRAGSQAWFPLGPGEPFHPWYHSGDAYRRRLNVATFGRVRNVESADVTTINYRNRRLAMTVVPVTTFRSGLPVSRRIIPITQNQILRARIAPHPFTLPGASAEAGGGMAPNTPRARRPTWFQAPAPRAAPTVRPNQPLVVRRAVPAPRQAPSAGPGNRPAAPAPRVLIGRHQPPPQEPPFQERQKAMRPDVGRPLEPQQIDNLRKGKPAGPSRDAETPAHPVLPAPRPAPAAAPAPRPAPNMPAPRAAPAAPSQRAAPAKPAPGKPAPKPADERRRGPGN